MDNHKVIYLSDLANFLADHLSDEEIIDLVLGINGRIEDKGFTGNLLDRLEIAFEE